jgi:TolB-like protein/Tfp pilus assembly protein PilF
VSFFKELRRRNVYRAALAYLAVVWLLLQVADIVIPIFDGPEWLLQALFISAVLGFVLAMVLAWFYELTPEGIKSARDVEVGEGIRFTERKVDFLIIGLLVIAVGFLAVDDIVSREGANSIAVLPFDNRSVGDEGAEFFAAGIHDDLIVLLSKLSDIRVISSKSVERFRDTKDGIQQIAKALGVSAILEGGVRVAGDRVRINVQLTDVETETGQWAEVYDRELSVTNIFGIQSEVALNIVNSLQATLSPDERQRLAVVPTQNLQAYEAYLLGKQEMTRRTVASMREAIEQFQRATELDADFALAYVGLAESYFILQDWGHISSENARPMIREAATRALELDGQLGEAYVSLAPVYEMDGEYAAAEAAYIRGIELNPGYATAHSWYGLFLYWRMGRIEEAVEQAEQALLLNPLSALLRMAYGDILSAAGRFDNALSQYRRSIELDPEFGGAHKMIADHYLYAYGRTDDALESYRNAVAAEPDPDWIGDIGGVYLILGDAAAAERWTEKARLTDPDNIYVQRHLALLNFYRGQNDLAEESALKYLEGPFDVYIPYMLFILRNADLRAGRYGNARLRYEQFYPALAADDPVVHRSNYRAAIDLSVVLERMGERERSQRMLEKSLVAISNMPRLGWFGYGSADAEIYALLGRSEEALSAFRLAVDDGWWRHWFFWTELNPNLDSIRDEPEYGVIIARLKSDMAIELARVRAGETQTPDAVQ